MFEKYRFAISVGVVAAIALFIILSILRRQVLSKLIGYLRNGQNDMFNKYIDSLYVKNVLNYTTILDLKLNAAIINKKKQETTYLFEQILKRPLTPKTKQAYYMKAFNFYVGLEDGGNAKKYLNLINELPNEQMKKEADRVYNIYILKNDKYLNELLEELEHLDESAKGVHEFLISKIYRNTNKIKLANMYESLSRKHFEQIDEQTAIKLNKNKK